MYNTPLLEFLNMGGGEMMLIVIAILLLFGGKKLPELARGLGKGIREFKDASEGVKREIQRNINSVDLDNDPPTTAQQTYREPDVDHSYSIHEEEQVQKEELDKNEENNEPKTSV